MPVKFFFLYLQSHSFTVRPEPCLVLGSKRLCGFLVAREACISMLDAAAAAAAMLCSQAARSPAQSWESAAGEPSSQRGSGGVNPGGSQSPATKGASLRAVQR